MINLLLIDDFSQKIKEAMKNLKKHLSVYMFLLIIISLMSCSQDSDLFLDALLMEQDVVIEGRDSPVKNDSVDNSTNEIFDIKNSENTNKILGFYTPSSAAEFTDPERANYKAIITKSFDCTGCVLASNQTIEPAGGVISGTNISLNGAYIENTLKQAFSSSTTFNSLYSKSQLSPDVFGGFADDTVDDTAAIDALINNSELATAKNSGKYIKNAPSTYSRLGSFDWNMNGAIVETNSSSKFRINDFDVDYIFTMTNLSPRIYNGEFDGTNTYGRLFWLKGQETFYFADLYVHDYHSTSNARAVAFKTNLYPLSYGFSKGEFYRNKIDNISSDSDGVANNVNGLSKGVYISLYEDGEANVYLEGNVVTNILGDDAESLYIAPHGSATMSNRVFFYLTGETYKYAKRRQAKITVSNVQIKDSYFEAPLVEQDFNGQAATIVGVFSTKKGQNNKNFKMINCDLVSNGVHTMSALSVTEMENAIIDGNRIAFSEISNYAGVNLGSGTTGYFGVFKNNTIKNNTFTNCGFQISRIFNAQDAPVILENNTFNYNYRGENPGNYVAALRYTTSSNIVAEPITFKNNTINFNSDNSFNLFTGVFLSFEASIQNLTIDSCKINYTGEGTVGSVFGRIGTKTGANFGNTNLIKDCSISGASGVKSVSISGSDKSVKINNSTDNLGKTITLE